MSLQKIAFAAEPDKLSFIFIRHSYLQRDVSTEDTAQKNCTTEIKLPKTVLKGLQNKFGLCEVKDLGYKKSSSRTFADQEQFQAMKK